MQDKKAKRQVEKTMPPSTEPKKTSSSSRKAAAPAAAAAVVQMDVADEAEQDDDVLRHCQGLRNKKAQVMMCSLLLATYNCLVYSRLKLQLCLQHVAYLGNCTVYACA